MIKFTSKIAISANKTDTKTKTKLIMASDVIGSTAINLTIES